MLPVNRCIGPVRANGSRRSVAFRCWRIETADAGSVCGRLSAPTARIELATMTAGAPGPGARRTGLIRCKHRARCVRLAVPALLAMLALVTCDIASATQRVLVVASSESAPFLQALQGGRDVADGLPVESLTLGITSESGLRAALARSGRDTAIVSFGARAGALLAEVGPSSSITSCLTPSSDASSQLGNVQGARIALPAKQRVLWLKRLLPQAHHVGILYDPAVDSKLVEPLAAAL